MDNSDQLSYPPTPTSSRKRTTRILDETEHAREKREKARERQRRKRERDRAGMSVMSFQQPAPLAHQQSIIKPDADRDIVLGPEEAARREKVRAAARERQRKHRALVKAKRMAELGLSMDNLMPNPTPVGPYAQILHDGAPLQTADQHPHLFNAPPPHSTGGQTFASTLLLSFSCAPLLRQHLLRNLNMTNDELASFEPVIAAAWDHWDQERQRHYATVAAAQGTTPGGSPYPVEDSSRHPHHPAQQGGPYPIDDSSNDFRTRFQQPLLAPTPFRTQRGGVSNADNKRVGQDGIDPSLQSSQTSEVRVTRKPESTIEQAEDRSGSMSLHEDEDDDEDEVADGI